MKTTEETSVAVPSGPPPHPGAVLVLERWNTWARVWFSETDETAWVNLAEVDFRPVPATRSAVGDEG